jgi:hypothetical protein
MGVDSEEKKYIFIALKNKKTIFVYAMENKIPPLRIVYVFNHK